MPARVKICGLNTADSLAAALSARADLVGFVFFPPSPRHLSIDEARPLADYARGQAAIVALTVDPDNALLQEIVDGVNPDMIQLHGSETPERVAEVRATFAKPVMKAIKVASAADAAVARAYKDVADLILFDARAPAGSTLPGGNGEAFDWRHLEGVRDEVAFMLSGGLTIQNVGEAISVTGATVVDVSSGVEEAPGVKSAALIRAFMAAAKAPAPSS
ncbi:MAG: phosphoribosylanthranilate isomerase [Pseudomonadota bacterium]